MGIIGKFVSNAWNGIKEKLGTAGKMIKKGAGKAWNFVKENHEPLEKIAGTALSAAALIKTGGGALPFIIEGNKLIQSLPDNSFTKHLKNVAKGAVLDYSSSDKPEQANALVEYQAPPLRRLTPPSSASPPSPIVRRAVGPPKVKRALTHTPLNSILEFAKFQRIIPQTIKRNKTKGKKSKPKKAKGKKASKR